MNEEMTVQSPDGETRIRFRVVKPEYTAQQILDMMNTMTSGNPKVMYSKTTMVIVIMPACRSIAQIIEWTGPMHMGQWEAVK